MIYIKPNLKRYNTLKALLESKVSVLFFEPNIQIEELHNQKQTFLISEPGIGKTRLLKEQLLHGDKEGIFIDLKKLRKITIDSFIETNGRISILKEKNYNEDLKNWKIFKTKKFKLENSNKLIFCFDALDEVKDEDFSEVVDNLKNFMQKYNQSNFLISCRKNYLNKWQHLFSEIDFDYIEIFPLDTPKIKDYLSAFGIDQKKIDDLLERLWFQNRPSILQSPRYLEMIAELVEKEGVDKLKTISRGELFEKFIYKKINIESEKTNEANCQEIIKKVLEKLALIMEIYQSNQITKDELMEFFDNTKSNLNVVFLNQVSINYFYERSLLKDNIDSIEFENTEFQEYLAAKEILSLGRLEQVIFDLAVVKYLGEIHPSWINTLSFLIESEINILKNVFEYVFSNPQSVHSEEHIRLLAKYNVEKLALEDKKDIFKMVYSYYQDTGHWIDYDIAEKLSFYYEVSLHEYIEKDIINKGIKGDAKKVIKANSATLVAFLVEKKLLTEAQREKWKIRLKRFLYERNQNEVVLRRSLFALGKFKEMQLFTSQLIKKVFNAGDTATIANLIHALEDIDLNHPVVINCILKGVKINNASARRALYKIKEKDGLKQVLDEFIKDNSILYEFIEYEDIYQDEDEEFIKNLKRNTDGFAIVKLKKIVTAALSNHFLYRTEKSHFIQEIVLLIKEYSPKYIFELARNYSSNDNIFALEYIFSLLLGKEDIQKFIKSIKDVDNNLARIAVQTLQQIRYSSRSDNEEIYELGRHYLKNEYKQIEAKEAQITSKQQKRDMKIYNDFKYKLKPKKNKYFPDVFQFYFDNKDKLEPFLTEADKSRLGKLVKGSVFNVFDPGKQKLTINQRYSGGSTTYTTDTWIKIFGTCILVAKVLELDISPYRQKILNYIPFSYYDHYKTISVLIPNPTDKELNNVLKLYQDRNDDLIIFMPRNIIDLCGKYKIKRSIPILEFFVESDQISFFDRKDALNSIAQIDEGAKIYFQNIFSKYKVAGDKQQELADVANEILIRKFKDEDAIKWRFEELKSRAFTFKRAKGAHSIGFQEREIDDKEFAQPLIQLKNVQYKSKFLRLLEDSFEILKKGKDYFAYASYLWEIVVEYFKNLKELRSYKILEDLEFLIKKHAKQNRMNWFSYRFQQLKLEYIIYIGKPQNISDCIKKYNFFKEKIYLDISTPRDLFDLIKKIINEDLKKWVEDEGAYKFIEKYKPQKGQKFEREDLIQKTIKTQFENGLLKADLRKEDFHIQRESRLLDDKRTDFLISYGFIGPILIEIKLTKNNEITDKVKREKYKSKLIQYIKGTNSHYGIFIIFQTESNNSLEKYLPILQQLYKTEKYIEVVGLNCNKQ